MFDRTFKKMETLFSTMSAEMSEAMAGDVCITNNNGHVVIVGPIKSLRVNDIVITLEGK